MRTVKQLPAGNPYTTNDNLLDGTVLNETPTTQGTPVVEEIIGDILVNIWKLVRFTGGVPNGLQDNEDNGYQLLAALQNLPNLLSGVEQPLNLVGTAWSLNLKFALLPQNFVIVARAAEAYASGVTYTITGTDNIAYNFTATNPFNSGDEVMLIINTAGVRAVPLTQPTAAAAPVFTPFGIPLAYADGSKVYYQSEGILMSDQPEAYDLQSPIRTLESNGTTVVYEMLLVNGYILCLAFDPTAQTYRFYKYSLTNLGTPVLLTMNGGSFPTGNDAKPFIYTDGQQVYITNHTGNNANDNAIDIYTLDIVGGTLIYSGIVTLDSTFQKTTNAAVLNGKLYTFAGGVLNKYDLGSGVKTYINTFPTYAGAIFRLNGGIYYSNGEVAKQWALS